jgi:predicted small metal-binding protein
MAHQFSCSACGFQVRSENDDELIELVRNHAGEIHDMDVSPSDVRAGWEDASLGTDD